MSTWIFQGNPKRFNVDDYLLENESIWWSIRQHHLAERIQLGDVVFIWRSDGTNKGSGGIIARTEVISLPRDYTNDDGSSRYWYEDVSGDTYLAVELKVLEVEVENLLKRTVLLKDDILKELPILKLKQNTNYLLDDNLGLSLSIAWKELSSSNNVTLGDTYDLPVLDSNGRVREYNYYPDELKGQVIFEHLINNKTHRWMDINILGRDGNTNGRDSANILYYLGMRADYRGIFEGKSLEELIEILLTKGEDYKDIVRLLSIYGKSKELYEKVKSDIDAQEVEEGNRVEGTKKTYYVNTYERDPKNRKKAIEIHGVTCFACGFNFEKVYGERGKDFIEVHHIKPLSTLEKATEINPETDLVPLCANCHRMIHRRKDDVLSVEDLKKLIKWHNN